MTDFRKLLDTLESMNEELMEVNDSFDLELNDDLVIETGIVGFTEDGVILEADDKAIELLEKSGAVLNESKDWSQYDKPTAARIKSGETEPVDRTDYDTPPAMRDKMQGKPGYEKRREKLKQMGEGDEIAEIKHLSGLKEGSREAVEDAIKHRIMRQHADLLKDHGLDKVMAAIEDTASGLDDLEEIGSSDISAWVNQIKRDLDSGMYDGVKETKEEDVSDLAKMKENLLTMIKAQRESGNEKAAAELEGMLKQKFPHQQDMKEDKKKISGNKEWVVTGTWTHRKYQREPFTIDTKVRANSPEEAMRKYKSWMWDKYERKVIDMKVKPYTGQAVTLGGPDAGKEAPVVAEGIYTRLSTYRVKDPELIDLLSSQDGAEMEVMAGGDGKDVGILTVDTITFPKLATMAAEYAKQKKIEAIAGPATRDMTGRAVTVGTKYPRNEGMAEGAADDKKYANTLEVRKLMRERFGFKNPYVHRSTDPNMVYLTFETNFPDHAVIPRQADDSLKNEVVQAFDESGFSNRVSVTRGMYLNIKAKKSSVSTDESKQVNEIKGINSANSRPKIVSGYQDIKKHLIAKHGPGDIQFYSDDTVDHSTDETNRYKMSRDKKGNPFIHVTEEAEQVNEAEYQGRKVPLGKPMQGDVKKFKVYVRKPNGKVVKVNFGDKKMRIKKSNPKRRKSFRARHRCENPGPRWKARYWSCRKW